MERRDKVNYYLDLAEMVSQRSTCLRKHYGAVIVNNDEVISTGYVGAPRGRKNCSDIGRCIREELHVPRGERYELCRSVHAEANALISASRERMIGASLYLTGVDARTGGIFHHQSSPDEKIGYTIVPFCFACKNSYTALFFSGTDRIPGKPCQKCVYVIFNINTHISGCQSYLTYVSRQIKKIFPIFRLLFLFFVDNFYHSHITPSGMRISHEKCRF